MFIICLRFVFVYLWPRHHKTSSKKYVNINGKVSKDKWQSMFRYFVKYVETFFYRYFSDSIDTFSLPN